MLFEKLVITRMRSTVSEVTVTTGLMYGHKIMKIGEYQFTELDSNLVSVDSKGFHANCKTWEELEFLLKAIA